MKRIAFVAAIGLSTLCPVAANAGPEAEKLGRCLVESASPKDKGKRRPGPTFTQLI